MSSFLKTLFKSFATFALKATFVFVLVLIVLFAGITSFFSNQSRLEDKSTFNVQGSAEREVTPDRAVIVVGTYLEGDDPRKIQESGNEKITKALAEIKELGIEESNIKTSGYNLNPKYRYDDGVSKIDGYRLNIEIEVKIDGVDQTTDQVSEVIGVAYDNGLEEVRNLGFQVTNRDEIIEELKLEAIDDAKSKKGDIESKTGINLGKIVNVNFGGNGEYPVPLYDYEAAEERSTLDSGSIDVQIETGETKISTSVTIIYEVL